ncbi:MAG: N-acetylornithine carbamoyltransferase [Bacteroidota bacterium]
MRHFTSLEDVSDINKLIKKSLEVKKDPFQCTGLGKNKTIGLVFFNSSLRTRMSITRAATNLGLSVITLNVNSDSWKLEFEDGTVMDGASAEHIREAVPILCSYCELLAVRSFPSLINQEEDYSERVLMSFIEHGNVPIINMESATVHPLQSLADVVTILEYQRTHKPKVVMTWGPHIQALPQAVSNSFAQWANAMEYDFVITHPKGLDLDRRFVGEASVEHDQEKALEGADFVYVKNWSSYQDYGKVMSDKSWQMTLEKLKLTNNARLMHCLPVRRNVVISDDALDSEHSIIIPQAENRLYTTQAVIQQILLNL